MKPERSRPEILAPPENPQACRTRKTITARPGVAAKTRQKHDYPSAAWPRSRRRRTASERLNSSVKDTATGSTGCGWIRLTGITPLMLCLSCMMVVRNQPIVAAWNKRQHNHARHAAERLPPRTRKPRPELASAGPAPP